jgi:hypothetical protein
MVLVVWARWSWINTWVFREDLRGLEPKEGKL